MYSLPLSCSPTSCPFLECAPRLLKSLHRISWQRETGCFGLSYTRDNAKLLLRKVVRFGQVPSWRVFREMPRIMNLSLVAAMGVFPPKQDVVKQCDEIAMRCRTKEKLLSVPKAAFFDVDGTITRTNVVLAYFTHRITELPFVLKLFWLPWFALTSIFYLIVDSINRAAFNRIFYLSYRGRSVKCKSEMANLIYKNYYQPRIFGGAMERIQKLKQQGYWIVFVTGCLDFLISPLACELGADYVYAAELVEENGRFTGKLKGMAASNAEKADRVREYAKLHGISLNDSLAFGDSVADVPMLEVVGYPHVVNPDPRLQVLAKKRGWAILRWALKEQTVPTIAV
eukprot:c30961_g1_i1 orf=112-1134(+)